MTALAEKLSAARAADRLGALGGGLVGAAERRDYAAIRRVLEDLPEALDALGRGAEGAAALRGLRGAVEEAARRLGRSGRGGR